MFRAEEMVNNSNRQMKEEEGRCIAAKKRIQKLNKKLTEAEKDKKSTEVALEGAERQVEGQRRQLC